MSLNLSDATSWICLFRKSFNISKLEKDQLRHVNHWRRNRLIYRSIHCQQRPPAINRTGLNLVQRDVYSPNTGRMNWKSVIAFTGLLALSVGQHCPAVPANFSLPPVPVPDTINRRQLPDPFLGVAGKRISKRGEWGCRRSEISQLAQIYEYGQLPGKPPIFAASLTNTTGNQTDLVINAGIDNTTISFSARISYPTIGRAPYPAIIVFGAATIPLPPDLAVITFMPEDLGQQTAVSFPPGHRGKFYTLYGTTHSAGLTAAYTWGVSRIIDALQERAESGIDAQRIGITGCSRYARVALAASAFDERIVLTIAQEGGEGADACWRLYDDDKGGRDICYSVQCPAQENDDGQGAMFKQYVNKPWELPFDQHSVAAMIAPRALLVLQNSIDWLLPRASFGCMVAAHKVWEALGSPERMAVLQSRGHPHCQPPDEQKEMVAAYVDRFLTLSGDAWKLGNKTDVVKSESTTPSPSWNWDVPALSD